MTPDAVPDDAERAEFRAFVRAHHPDRGGDPAAFADGLARFGRGATPADGATADPAEARYERPVEVVATLPFPVRVGVALIRTWHRRRNPRVE